MRSCSTSAGRRRDEDRGVAAPSPVDARCDLRERPRPYRRSRAHAARSLISLTLELVVTLAMSTLRRFMRRRLRRPGLFAALIGPVQFLLLERRPVACHVARRV